MNEMKKSSLMFFIIFAAAVFSSVFAQQETPAGAGDKSLRDDNIRMRSIDLERVKKDATKTNAASNSATMNSDIDKKYPEIKEDFEGIQNNQAEIVKAYTTGEKIDYNQIKTLAEAMNKNAKRLDENLFEPRVEVKKKESKEMKEEKTKEVKELIVDLDNAIGDFISSPMFQNLRVVDPEVAGKARHDLEKIAGISELLASEANKMK